MERHRSLPRSTLALAVAQCRPAPFVAAADSHLANFPVQITFAIKELPR